MSRLFPTLALLCALPLSALPQQAVAIEDSDREDPHYYYSALIQMQDDTFGLDIETQREEAVGRFLEIAEEAASAQQRYAAQPDEVKRFAEMEGIALYYAAEYNLFDSADTEARAQEVSWLVNGIAAFERVITDDLTAYFPFYEYAGSASLLFEHGVWLDDPRLPEWSSSKVKAARGRLAQNAASADDPASLVFEKNALAQALFESGFLTKEQASIDEANAILQALGEDNVDYYSYDMREAVSEGRAPYPAPGEDY